MTLILRDKYLFGATLFIYLALFFFLDQWEQSTSSFPCWEMTAGLVSQLSNQKKFWVLVSMSGHVFFSLYDCFLLTLTLWLIFNKPAVKQHSRVLICHLSPRKSHGTHLMTCGQWLGDGHPSSKKENCFIIECSILSPASAFTEPVIYSSCTV